MKTELSYRPRASLRRATRSQHPPCWPWSPRPPSPARHSPASPASRTSWWVTANGETTKYSASLDGLPAFIPNPG